MKHISFDLETLGTSPSAPIIQIGAVEFTEEGIITNKFYRNVNWKSLEKYPFNVDYSTIKFWMKQSDAARNSVLKEEGSQNIKKVLKEFSAYVKSIGRCKVWSHATFDPVVLTNSYRVVGIDQPISFRNFCDIRTLNYLANITTSVSREGTHHDALDDAIFQAKYISEMLRKINKND
jgi:DNA polymerase III epsilon subunit-like protein